VLRRMVYLTMALLLTSTMASTVAAFPDGGDPEGGSYPIAAYLCDSDPGNWSPYSNRSIGGGCEPLEGVTFSAALERDGVELDTCTTDGDGTCAVDVPGDVPLLITEDVSTVPDGYAPRENPVGGYNATEFRGSRVYNLPEGAPLTPTAIPPTPTPGSRNPPTGPGVSQAAIVPGTCAKPDVSRTPLVLFPVAAPNGELAGAEATDPVETTDSVSELYLDQLLADPYTVTVYDQDDASVALACGEMGGIVGPDGSVAIGLQAVNGSRYSGIAVVSPVPGGAKVVVYLAPDLDGSDNVVDSITGDLSASNGSSAAIYAGTCRSADTSDALAVLEPVGSPDGDEVGADGPAPVESSMTTADIALDDLLAEDHVLIVFDQDDPSMALTCGAIGGIVSQDGLLTIGLRALGESRYSGIAVLAQGEGGTDVLVYLAAGLDGSGV
jgi:hypothetical protein